MGNQIVIPASKDWWSSILNPKNYYVKEQIQSGSLFLKFICTDVSKNDRFIVKAYQNERLSSIPNYKEIKKYFEILTKSDIPMIYYIDIIENSNSAFFIRRRFGQPLSDLISQEANLYTEEKFWITYQLFTALDSFHKINIFHGDLKPSNIIYVPSGRVYIVDPAPFKPITLDQYHPHYFYYFFANDSSSGCYLAPERLLGTLNSSSKMPFGDLILADLFSLGCIIAFMYLNGEHLFNADTARKFGKGEYRDELDASLSAINDEKIIRLIKGLISRHPHKRKETFDAFYKNGFPSDFKIMIEKFFPKQDFFVLNQKAGSKLFDYNCISSNPKVTVKTFPLIVKESNLLKGTSKNPVTVGTRINYFNYFSYRALKARSLNDINYIIDFIIDFSRDFDDESKLMRLVPLFIQLLDIEICTLRRKLLFELVRVFQSIQQIPKDIKKVLKESILPLFRRKFRREGINLGWSFASDTEIDLILFNQNMNAQSSASNSILMGESTGNDNGNDDGKSGGSSVDSYFAIIAEFLPFFAFEVLRLQPEYHKDCISAFNFLPKNSVTVFKVFAESMRKVLKNSPYFYYRDFSIFIRNFFFSGIDHKIIYMEIIIEAYSHFQPDEKPYFIDDLVDILPMIVDSVVPNNKVNFTFFDPGTPGEISTSAIDSSNVQSMSKSRPGLPIEWDGPECLKWEEFTMLSLQFFILLLEKEFIDQTLTYAIAGIIIPLLNSKSDKIYSLLSILNRYFTPYAKQMPLFIFINDRLADFKGHKKEVQKGPDLLKLIEKKKYSSSEHVKFANPFLTVPLVRKYKRIPLSPRFVQSKRRECGCVTSVALDKEMCIYVLDGKKIRCFKNNFGSDDKEPVNELIYRKNDKNETRAHYSNGLITHIDILSHDDNCCFSGSPVVAYQKGRIDCIDLRKGFVSYSKSGSSGLTVSPCVQMGYENEKDLLTSFCALKKRCCLASGRWNGCIEVLDIRAAPSTSGEGCFGFIGGGGASIPFKFDSLVSLVSSPVSDDYLFAGFSNGMVISIDLRVGLPVSETLTIPAYNIWPVAAQDGTKNSCIAVYDGQSTIDFVSEPKNNVVKKIRGRSFVGSTFNGGVVLADGFSASYIDIVNDEDNVRLYDGAMLPIRHENLCKDKFLSFPDFNDGEMVFPESDNLNESAYSYNYNANTSSLNNTSMSISGIGGFLSDAMYDDVEKQIRKSVFSVHMHKSPLKCIAKYENLFVTGDSTGFVNLWTICSSEASKILPTYT